MKSKTSKSAVKRLSKVLDKIAIYDSLIVSQVIFKHKDEFDFEMNNLEAFSDYLAFILREIHASSTFKGRG
jgi:hypothetical protein